ncbi:hypothetical protein SeLEV6574_g02793 [Synchytrium endobioticum]|uniref:Uncharacterized protein n=1 Tax=Synchytrium endobioticum TaxID=286115 RepID=A0A507D6W4_9FUNG|nr:hypothetical protein SeLEV6574_g02793 [Synchytrium endobioticum]
MLAYVSIIGQRHEAALTQSLHPQSPTTNERDKGGGCCKYCLCVVFGYRCVPNISLHQKHQILLCIEREPTFIL